jgi:predicted RNA-binding Zn-ribbon protein involved in translation (DUF1610 family)
MLLYGIVRGMASESLQTARTTCKHCGFSAPVGADVWDTAVHPTLGDLMQCPECGSTDTTSGG